MTLEEQLAPTIPAPPVKACGCGATHDLLAWSSLPLVAARWEGLELRNCFCSSTLAIELQAAAE